MKGYCLNCGKEIEDITITESEESITLGWSKIPIQCVQKCAYCNECGEEIYVSEISDENINTVWDSFYAQQPEKFTEGSWVKAIYEGKVEIIG